MTDTSKNWRESTEPDRMLRGLRELRGTLSDRHERLLACACCRYLWYSLPDKRSRRAIDVAIRARDAIDAAEAFADGLIGAAELKLAGTKIGVVARSFGWNIEGSLAAFVADMTWRLTRIHVAHGVSDVSDRVARWVSTGTQRPSSASHKNEALCAALAPVLREVLGNPFRPVRADPDWKTWRDGKLVTLARHIFRERDFASLPVFADALEEAGCGDPSVLEHCRSSTQHVRGCWALELILDGS